MSSETRTRLLGGLETDVLLGLLLGALAYKALYFGDLFGLALHNGSLTYTEGINGLLAARPDLWFHPFDEAPFLPTIYPLLYHAIVGTAARVTPLGVFQTMHLTAIVSAFVTGGVITHWLRERDVRWTIAVAGGLLYALSPTVTGGTVLGRVDHLGVLFGVLAAYTAARGGRGDPLRAAGWTVAAMFVKQSLIAFPIAIALWYWLNDYRRDAKLYTAVTAAIGLSLLGTLGVITDGRAIYQLVFLNAAQPWDAWYAFGLSAWAGGIHLGLVTGAAIILYYAPHDRFDVLLFVVAVAASFLLSGKPGAWTGYFLPPIAAGALLLGRGFETHLSDWDTTTGLLVLFLFTSQFGIYAVWQPAPEYSPDGQDAVVETLRDVDGPILTVDNGILVRLEKAQTPHESQLIRTLGDGARPEGAWLLDDIRAQKFDAIVLTRPVSPAAGVEGSRWSREQLLAMERNYVFYKRDGAYRVYVPKA